MVDNFRGCGVGIIIICGLLFCDDDDVAVEEVAVAVTNNNNNNNEKRQQHHPNSISGKTMAMTVSLSVAYRSTRRRITSSSSSCAGVPSFIILLLIVVAVDSFHLISSEMIMMMKKKKQQLTVHSFPIQTTTAVVSITDKNTILTALRKNKSSNNTSPWRRIETNIFVHKRDEELKDEELKEKDDEELPSSTGGESDLTDRFKYKVKESLY